MGSHIVSDNFFVDVIYLIIIPRTVSQVPIEPGRSSFYEFPIVEENVGTYFLHSHYGLQDVKGLAAPLIVEGPYDDDYPNADSINGATDVLLFLEGLFTTPGRILCPLM